MAIAVCVQVMGYIRITHTHTCSQWQQTVTGVSLAKPPSLNAYNIYVTLTDGRNCNEHIR